MKYKIIRMGLLSGLLGLFGCGDNKTAVKDSVQKINLDDVLFTTPTLENALPDFENKTDTSNLQFHEDDWRQFEFIAKDQSSAINKEMEKIKDIYDNNSHKGDAYMAFRKVAVRELITQPLAIDFSKTRSYLTDKNVSIYGVTLQNNPGQVRNGFSFSANGIHYYGQLDDNQKIKWLCIYGADNEESLKSSIDGLSKLLATENLYLVNWVQMKIFDETNIKTDFVTDGN